MKPGETGATEPCVSGGKNRFPPGRGIRQVGFCLRHLWLLRNPPATATCCRRRRGRIVPANCCSVGDNANEMRLGGEIRAVATRRAERALQGDGNAAASC